MIDQGSKEDAFLSSTQRRIARRIRLPLLLSLIVLPAHLFWPTGHAQSPRDDIERQTATNPILFVTQVPIPSDFTNVVSVFGNHLPSLKKAPRGGDLYILYPNGQLRNLTREAGYGRDGFQGENSIAVREPCVHWSGEKAVFSMVVGATERQYRSGTYRWQLYEVSGLALGQTAQIRKVPRQPEDFNNVSPIYSSDGRILFTSDRPRNGARHLYPQLDEYETAPTNSGLWSLRPVDGKLELLDHAPSGNFTPSIDSFGRVIFTRWDHLQRDQQADADAGGRNVYGTFDYSDESDQAQILGSRTEVFPEPRRVRTDLLEGTNLKGHSFNHFFPWMMRQDGKELETLNHIGRHELHTYFASSFNDDFSLEDFVAQISGRLNDGSILNMLQIQEDPLRPGRYLGVNAPEFFTHAAGQIISLTAPPGLAADRIALEYLTHRETRGYTQDGETPSSDHSGLYRSPLPLSDGTLIAVHTDETRRDRNDGSRAEPISRYDFRLKRLVRSGSYWIAGQPLTSSIHKEISYWDPDVLVRYSGPLWELDPVEVKPRRAPLEAELELEEAERSIFREEAVEVASFQADLRSKGLALVISRDVTRRDAADRQQPFNLRVAGSPNQTTGDSGKLYEVAYLQFFQGDQVRGIGGADDPRPGRRVLARAMHGLDGENPHSSGPAGSVDVALDGSMAALVPARRALSWQMTDPAGQAVVRERYWLTFQPGEIRVCGSCHGVNGQDQSGDTPPENSPEALRILLQHWKRDRVALFQDDFESGDLTAWDSVRDESGEVTTSAMAALGGSLGLATTIEGPGSAHLEHQFDERLDGWAVDLGFDPNSLKLSESSPSWRRTQAWMDLLTLSSGGKRPQPQVTLSLRGDGLGYRIQVQVRDNGRLRRTPWLSITDAPQQVRLVWRRSQGAEGASGRLELILNGRSEIELSDLDNARSGPSILRIGAVQVYAKSIRGTVFFDDVSLQGL